MDESSFAKNRAYQLLNHATEALDHVYGEGYSKKNPMLMAQVAIAVGVNEAGYQIRSMLAHSAGMTLAEEVHVAADSLASAFDSLGGSVERGLADLAGAVSASTETTARRPCSPAIQPETES